MGICNNNNEQYDKSYAKKHTSEFQITGIASQYVGIHFFVRLVSIDPSLKYLTIVNCGLTSYNDSSQCSSIP